VSKTSGTSMLKWCKFAWAPCVVLLSSCSGDGDAANPRGEPPEGTVTGPVTSGATPDVGPDGDALMTSAPALSTAPDGSAGADGTGNLGNPSPTFRPDPPAALVDAGSPGRSLIRRLSNAEYEATIHTLLGDDTNYAASFPADTVVNGFTNNTDVQDVGPALAEQYMVAAGLSPTEPFRTWKA
jgi:hypothetical protein